MPAMTSAPGRSLFRTAAIGLASLLLTIPSRAEQPDSVELAEGVYVHELSRFVFPEEVAGYERLDLKNYDDSGANYSVGYGWTDGRTGVVMTVFVYSVPATRDSR